MDFSAFGVVQIAAAVLAGNALTLVLVKGFQILEKDEPQSWYKYMAYAVPSFFVLVAIIGSTS